jgi:hypothetical protein
LFSKKKYWVAAWYPADGRLLLPGLLMAGCCYLHRGGWKSLVRDLLLAG